MKSCRKLSKNCSIHGKNREISGPYNFLEPVTKTETIGPCLVQKLKWGAMDPLAPPVATPLHTEHIAW